MGFFGGGSSSKTETNQGYWALSPRQRRAVMNNVEGLSQFVSPYTFNPATNKYEVNQANIDRFTPLEETADETRAYELMRQGFTPDQARLDADIAMQQNPYDKYVIDEINRQSTGDYSILKSALSEAGQLGSNRQNLGANDIDLSRLNQIGAFKQQGFANAMNNALTVLPTLRQNDATNLAGIGAAQRGLAWDTQQAPVNALNASVGGLQGLGFSSAVGNTAQSTTTQKSGGGGFGGVLSSLGGLASGISSLGGTSMLGGLGLGTPGGMFNAINWR